MQNDTHPSNITPDLTTTSIMDIKLEILYQDEYCIAINKPTGMLVHKTMLATSETQFAMQILRDQIGQHVYPVHRLDRPTSGVLLFALDSNSARILSEQFENHSIKKTYLAVVRGWADSKGSNQGQIDYPLSIIYDKIADKQTKKNKPPQSAITDWQQLAKTEQPFIARARYPTSRYSVLKLIPKTGRKHQLRRHMKHIFHPIIGDTSYGDHHQNRAVRKNLYINRLMLHSWQLEFTSPNGKKIIATAPVDDDWQSLLKHFGWLDIL